MKRNTEQCKDCIYWKSADGSEMNQHFCHHLLHTNKRREIKGKVCLSKKVKSNES